MEIRVKKETITKCHLTRSENIVIRYLFGLPIHPETKDKVLSADKDGRRKIFFHVMKKLFEVLEEEKEKQGTG